MRRVTLVTALLLAGCASRPEQPPVAEIPQQPQQTTNEPRRLLGRSPAELVAFFGQPALQVREGSSLKLQFRGQRCVLDAYLYPSGGQLHVTHVDVRTPSGADTDQAACIAALGS